MAFCPEMEEDLAAAVVVARSCHSHTAGLERCRYFDRTQARELFVGAVASACPESPYYKFDPASFAGCLLSWYVTDQGAVRHQKCFGKRRRADSLGAPVEGHDWRCGHHSTGLVVVRSLPYSVKR